MPAFVINLFSLFVFRPMLVELTEFWNTGKIAIFLKKVKGMCLLILGLTLGAMAGAYLLGIPVLELIYGVQLQEYRMELVLIMITGGISALSTFLYYIITVMRKQKYLLIGYGCSFLIALCLPKVLVKKFGITGAVASCTSALLVLVVAFFIIIAVHVIKKKKETSERR
jgi:O-antigen/teichoic acid export membrane protein